MKTPSSRIYTPAGQSAAEMFCWIAAVIDSISGEPVGKVNSQLSAEGYEGAFSVISLITDGMAAIRGVCIGSNPSENAGEANAGEYS